MAIRTVITDDEASARAGIRALLSRDRDVEVVAECTNVTDTLRVVVERQPELLFLDVQLSGSSGLELLERLPEKAWPVVIFVTAYETYARDAFDCHAADYLLKPYEDARFFKALERAKQRHRAARFVVIAAAPARFDGQSARPGFERRRSPAGFEISNESDDQNRHAGGDRSRRRCRLDRSVRRLRAAARRRQDHSSPHHHERARAASHPRQFVRIHRSSIVKVSAVVDLRRVTGEEYVAVLADGALRPVSARGWRRLEEAMGSAL
jgi:two-component system, LytTR family, response regulator